MEAFSKNLLFHRCLAVRVRMEIVIRKEQQPAVHHTSDRPERYHDRSTNQKGRYHRQHPITNDESVSHPRVYEIDLQVPRGR